MARAARISREKKSYTERLIRRIYYKYFDRNV